MAPHWLDVAIPLKFFYKVKYIFRKLTSADLKNDHLNTRNIWIQNFLKFIFQMVALCALFYVQDREFEYWTRT